MRESASADVTSVASWLSESIEVLINITWDDPSREAGERGLQNVREENICLPFVQECSAPDRQEGLVLHECSEVGMDVNIL